MDEPDGIHPVQNQTPCPVLMSGEEAMSSWLLV